MTKCFYTAPIFCERPASVHVLFVFKTNASFFDILKSNATTCRYFKAAKYLVKVHFVGEDTHIHTHIPQSPSQLWQASSNFSDWLVRLTGSWSSISLRLSCGHHWNAAGRRRETELRYEQDPVPWCHSNLKLWDGMRSLPGHRKQSHRREDREWFYSILAAQRQRYSFN